MRVIIALGGIGIVGIQSGEPSVFASSTCLRLARPTDRSIGGPSRHLVARAKSYRLYQVGHVCVWVCVLGARAKAKSRIQVVCLLVDGCIYKKHTALGAGVRECRRSRGASSLDNNKQPRGARFCKQSAQVFAPVSANRIGIVGPSAICVIQRTSPVLCLCAVVVG